MRKTLHLFIIFITTISLGYSQGRDSHLIKKDFLQVKDNQIYYEVSGSGVPVILIHGGYLNHEIWKKQINFLNKKGFKTVVYDDLGHGKTINGKEEVYGYQIVDEIRRQLNLEKINIIGLSWGSMIALDYALNNPKNLDRLILISPGLNGWNYFQDPKAEENFNQRQIAKINNDKISFVEYFQKNWTDGPGESTGRVKVKLRNHIGEILLNTVKNHWEENWSKLSTKTRWNSIEARTLIITGNLDAIDITKIAKQYDEEINQSQWIDIENVGHTLIVEKPKKVNRIINFFLKS
ncbi:alpha/beta fold hydrolase [Christiangramia echinicola]|uniref:alpha/beta fold hydrolase n=1 Tax=Christiangramia echinicola TaxID=279359 RepID=UPI000418AB2D|nr:alpha/beta hydrolase [Christiangramia echinicola]